MATSATRISIQWSATEVSADLSSVPEIRPECLMQMYYELQKKIKNIQKNLYKACDQDTSD